MQEFTVLMCSILEESWKPVSTSRAFNIACITAVQIVSAASNKTMRNVFMNYC